MNRTWKSVVNIHLASKYIIHRDRRAFDLLRRSSAEGNSMATAILGFCYEFGLLGLAIDSAHAEKLYIQSVNMSVNLLGASRLAFLKQYGRSGVIIDIPTAKEYQQICHSNRGENGCVPWLIYMAEEGLPAAQYCIAVGFNNGIGVEKVDHDKALSWCLKAVEGGLPSAANLLGNLYCAKALQNFTNEQQKSRDLNLSLQWYIKAAEKRDPAAIYNIGTMYERGLGVEQSISMAIMWYKRAARFGSASARNILGILIEDNYVFSDDIRGDPRDAVGYYTLAAVAGDPHAQYNLARCYHNGYGTKRDDFASHRWFARSARQNHALAIFSVGICWEFGIGVEETCMKKALINYEKSARLGCEKAIARLTPIIELQIWKASSVLFPNDNSTGGIFKLPVEIRMKILEKLNVASVLTDVQLRNIVRSNCEPCNNFQKYLDRYCSCDHQCTNMAHILAAASKINL